MYEKNISNKRDNGYEILAPRILIVCEEKSSEVMVREFFNLVNRRKTEEIGNKIEKM